MEPNTDIHASERSSAPPANAQPPHIHHDFILRMEDEIRANNHKGPWQNWQPEPHELIDEMQHHLNKLAAKILGAPVINSDGQPCSVAELSADLANFSMKAFECFGRPSSTLNPPSSPPIPCCPHFPDCEHANNERRGHVIEALPDAPKCPKCGAPVTRKDPGAPWTCTDFEECNWVEARD